MNLLYFKLAVRNLSRNKFNTLINVMGLSLSIAILLFIVLFIHFETSFDNFFPDGDRIYRIVKTSQYNDNISREGFCSYLVAPDVKEGIPGIDEYCRVTDVGRLSDVRPLKGYVDGKLYTIGKLRFVDPNFMSFFGFRMTLGNPVTALDSEGKIILSESAAHKIFGKEDPLGKEIVYNQKSLTISGVFADIPTNSHLRSDALISTVYVEKDTANYWLGWDGGLTALSYLKLTKGGSPTRINEQLPGFLDIKINKRYETSGWKMSMKLQHIKDVHLSAENDYDCESNRSLTSIYIVTTIAILILALAIINYFSLYTVQKEDQKKDISLFKIHGANRVQLSTQAFVEVLIVTFIASFLGAVLLELLLPFLNNYFQSGVSLKENTLFSFFAIFSIVFVLSLLITIFMLRPTRVSPVESFRGTVGLKGHGVFGNLLVTFQFVVVIFLITIGLLISKQSKYFLNKEMGFNKENILVVNPDKEFQNGELSRFRDELQKYPEISSVCLTSENVGTGVTQNGYKPEGREGFDLIHIIYTDANFLECFGISLTLGRNLNDNTFIDKNSVLANQQLLKKYNWEDGPIGKTMERNGPLTIVGVVGDFNFSSLESGIKPLIIMNNPAYDGWGYGCINIKYKTKDIRGLISKISNLWEHHFPYTPYQVEFLEDELAGNYSSITQAQKMITLFTSVTVVIACMGLLGLTAFVARKRDKEISIRKINGAKASEILVMLNRGFVKRVAIAFVIACPIAYLVMDKWLSNFAYRTALSWWVFALAGVVTLGIAVLTVSWQTWTAARSNPVESLRYE